jgi:hypothetical protein
MPTSLSCSPEASDDARAADRQADPRVARNDGLTMLITGLREAAVLDSNRRPAQAGEPDRGALPVGLASEAERDIFRAVGADHAELGNRAVERVARARAPPSHESRVATLKPALGLRAQSG